MGFFANIINYIKNIDIKKYFKNVIPSKQNIQNLTNKFRKKQPRTPDAEYGFTSPPPATVRQHLSTPAENPEPIYLQVLERKSVVGIVGPTSRLEDAAPQDGQLGRPSIYTDRTLVGINKLMNHLNKKKQRHTLHIPTAEEKRQAPKKPKRLSHETDDLKAYILDAINDIEMIRHQIHMKSEIVRTIDCNEADLGFVREYLTSCMIEIADIDTKGTREVESAKEDALYYARKWYDQLSTQLEAKQDAAEDIYVRRTLAHLDAVKNKLDRLSSEARMKDADNTDVIRRLSQYIDDVEEVDTKAIQKIEVVKRETLQLAEELTEHMHDDFMSKRSDLLRKSNEDTQIGDEDIYDEVSITSSSENVSIVISDSDSDVESFSGNAKQAVPSIDQIDSRQVRAPQFVIPDILIDSSEVQDIAQINTEKNGLSALHTYLPSDNTKHVRTAQTNNLKSETSKSIWKDNKLKFVAVDFGSLSSSDLVEEIISTRTDQSEPKQDFEQIKYNGNSKATIAKSGSNNSSSQNIPTIKQSKQITSTAKESPMPTHKLRKSSTPNHIPTNQKPPTLYIPHQETIPVRLSREELEFGYTQECLQEILLCRNRLECLADSVHSFRGTGNDDEFVFLQENITFSMMALNGIDAKNIKSVRDMKREAMMYGQIWYDELELKSQNTLSR